MRKLVLILATGYILMYFSEHLFWARFRPGDSLTEFGLTWAAYSLLAYAFLFLLHVYNVRSFHMLFLAGAVFGWLAEGVIVHTMYDDFPLNLSFTGLAWHSLISVCGGWAALNLLLRRADSLAFIGYCSALGWFWFFWGICWRFEEPRITVSPLAFAAFCCLTTILLAAALFASRWAWAKPVKFRARDGFVLAGLFGALFLLTAIPAGGWRALSAPALMAVVLLALHRSPRHPGQLSLQDRLSTGYKATRLLWLILLPAISVPLYSLAYAFDLRPPTHWLVYLLTMPAGFVLLVASLVRGVRQQRSD